LVTVRLTVSTGSSCHNSWGSSRSVPPIGYKGLAGCIQSNWPDEKVLGGSCFGGPGGRGSAPFQVGIPGRELLGSPPFVGLPRSLPHAAN